MRTWPDLKHCLRNEASSFSFARRGDAEGLKSFDLSGEFLDEKDSKGYTLLMIAAHHGHLELACYLVRLGADPNSVDHSGNSILMVAAFRGHAAIVRLLVENGADIHARNPKGRVALDFAQMFGCHDVVCYLKGRETHLKEKGRQKEASLVDRLLLWLMQPFQRPAPPAVLISSGYETRNNVQDSVESHLRQPG